VDIQGLLSILCKQNSYWVLWRGQLVVTKDVYERLCRSPDSNLHPYEPRLQTSGFSRFCTVFYLEKHSFVRIFPWQSTTFWWKPTYKGVTKSFRTGLLERGLQMVELSATRCSCMAILWVSLVSFAAITLCVASQRVFIVVSVYFVIYSVRKLLDRPRTVYL
jgi:hypothetical protein